MDVPYLIIVSRSRDVFFRISISLDFRYDSIYPIRTNLFNEVVTNFKFVGDIVTVDIYYEKVLAADFPNGMKAGKVLRLNGQSEFEFKDGKIYRITDFS